MYGAEFTYNVTLSYLTVSLFLSSVKGQCSQSGITITLPTGSSGNVSSPNFPSNYPNSMTCRWIITVPQGHLVRLSFNDFQLTSCFVSCSSCDHLEVRDGTDDSSAQLARYCGTELPYDVQSSGQSLWIEFVSTSTNNEKGFLATYTTVGM